MDRRRLLALSAALAAGSFAGCLTEATRGPTDGTGTETGDDTDSTPDAGDEALAELVRETNGLAFDLYDTLLAAGEDDNLLASPISISTALAMAYAGARGETRTQMREALRYTLDDETLHAAFAALLDELNARGEDVDDGDLPPGYDEGDDPVPFRLALVNAAWGQLEYPFREAYLETVDEHYGAGGLREVDYTSNPEAAREEINAWVAERTEDRIDDLLPEGALDELTRLVLTNAVYFLANWHRPFEEAATSPGAFTALDGTPSEVPMMDQHETFRYADVEGVQAVELPYVGEDVSMLVLLPPAGSFESAEAALDGAALARIVDALGEREGRVRLPRFAFASKFALRDALETLGMPIAFDPNAADFSGMARLDEANENLYVDDVYHDTYVAVDETGTEAAAATGVVVKAESAPADPFEFVADRPFLFAIRDRPTGTVLFLGRVVDAGATQ